jgi:hypothetical protein
MKRSAIGLSMRFFNVTMATIERLSLSGLLGDRSRERGAASSSERQIASVS